MGLTYTQQLEAFAYWYRHVLRTDMGKRLWSVPVEMERRLMNQAPFYFLDFEKIDLYAEATLLGDTRVDLSAQYCAAAFAEGNRLRHPSVEQEGNFFHYYSVELAKLKPELLKNCFLYLEADITANAADRVASFINLTGDFVGELLLPLLAYKSRLKLARPVLALLEQIRPYCLPWHFGFMESREEKSLRLVLILKQGVGDLQQVLQIIGAPSLPDEGMKLLEAIDNLKMFHYMLDIDVLPDGSIGTTVGVELLPENAIYPGRQMLLAQTAEYTELLRLLQETGLADERVQGLLETIFAARVDAETYLYSRISHFKLRWQQGQSLPAKVYVQLRSIRAQSCLNEAMGYKKVLLEDAAENKA